jgi:hypothetical protein
LVHHSSNGVFVLPDDGAVVRLTASRTPEAVETNQAVVRTLVRDHGFPATDPLDDVPSVRLDHGLTASFWRYYPQPTDPRPFTVTHLADLLHRLHHLPEPAGLATWTPLTSLHRILAQGPWPAMSDDEAAWLADQAQTVSRQVLETDWPLGVGLLHGDAWAGNLLWDHDTPIFCDWDSVSRGPREVDLVPAWHAVHRYGRPLTWVQEFADAYGYDRATSQHFDLLLRMRDLVQLPGPLRRSGDSPPNLAAFRCRFEAIRYGNGPKVWI